MFRRFAVEYIGSCCLRRLETWLTQSLAAFTARLVGSEAVGGSRSLPATLEPPGGLLVQHLIMDAGAVRSAYAVSTARLCCVYCQALL